MSNEESNKEEEINDNKESSNKSDNEDNEIKETSDLNNKENNNEEEEEEEEENESEENEEKKEKKNNSINSNKIRNNIPNNYKKYEEDKIQNNLLLLEEHNNYSLINEEIGAKREESKNIKILKEIKNDLIEISDNIEKLYIKLDTSLIQDEKYLIDSIIIEAKKEGLLKEEFIENNKKYDKINIKYEKEDLKINNDINNTNKNNRINLSNIYEYNNNKLEENKKNKFPYDYGKNKEYYESLNKKLNYLNNSNYMNNSNDLKNSSQMKSDILFNSKEKDYFINNKQLNNNYYDSSNNFSFKINMNINASNNLLSSIDTTGPYRYTRKNRNEPDLMNLLMNK
jgi:hypothetical protein